MTVLCVFEWEREREREERERKTVSGRGVRESKRAAWQGFWTSRKHCSLFGMLRVRTIFYWQLKLIKIYLPFAHRTHRSASLSCAETRDEKYAKGQHNQIGLHFLAFARRLHVFLLKLAIGVFKYIVYPANTSITINTIHPFFAGGNTRNYVYVLMLWWELRLCAIFRFNSWKVDRECGERQIGGGKRTSEWYRLRVSRLFDIPTQWQEATWQLHPKKLQKTNLRPNIHISKRFISLKIGWLTRMRGQCEAYQNNSQDATSKFFLNRKL